MKSADICIGTMGLDESIGWKTAEYVAAGRAILVVAWILLLCVGMSFPIEKMQKAVFSFEDKVKQYL